MTRYIIALCLGLINCLAADSQPHGTQVQLRATVQDVRTLSGFSGAVVSVDTDPRYALTLRLESVTGATNLVPGKVITFAIHSPSKLFAGEPAKRKAYDFELERRIKGSKVTFSGLRLRAANQSRQPTAGVRLAMFRPSLARRGCALRSAEVRGEAGVVGLSGQR